ncbi:MAG: VWA domain-containing protein [Thermoanaerobaculia bacterium]
MKSVRNELRKSFRVPRLLVLVPLLPFLAAWSLRAQPAPPAAPPAAPSDTQTSKIAAGLVSVPITVKEEYLGRSGTRTVVRFTLSVAKGDLRKGGADQPRTYSFFLTGEAKDPAGKVVETFRVPVDADLSGGDISRPLTASFLRSFAPGPLSLQFRLEGVAGKAVGMQAVSLTVPAMPAEFKVESAGLDASGQPSAAAIIMESENRDAVPEGGNLVKILAPKKEVPVGLIRIDCEVRPPVVRVEFFLGEKKILVRNRAPYTVELDLGKIPKKQTLKAIGFDRQGNFIDADAWAINERDARLAVRILELPASKTDTAQVDLKVAVQSIAGGVAKNLKLFLDDKLLKEWGGPPFIVSVSGAELKKATLLRATAVDEEGKEFSDIKFLKGDSRFVSSVDVNLVELNVSVYNEAGVFTKGLHKEDFTVLEDGAPQSIGAFEFAESLPLSLGLVIDGSGSMSDSMPLVHQAATEFVQKLVGEKDQGFVIEFREAPVVLAAMTKKPGELIRAVAETRASGGTALYDSVVMSLYQFRAVPGKKAVVVLTDGKDNHSWTDYDTLRRYTRSAKVPVYFIGLDLSFLEVGLKGKMRELAADTGGEAFFVGSAKGLPEIYKKIETELRSQYFLSYLTNSRKPDTEFRTIDVKLKDPKLRAKTIRGFFP